MAFLAATALVYKGWFEVIADDNSVLTSIYTQVELLGLLF